MSEIKLELGGAAALSENKDFAIEHKKNSSMLGVGNGYNSLSETEKKAIENYSKSIDITDSMAISNYGVDAQSNMSNFSDSVLENVKTKDTGEVGTLISSLVGQISSYNDELGNTSKLKRIFSGKKRAIETFKAKYRNVEGNIDKIVEDLEAKSVTLGKDIYLMDALYKENENFYRELTYYILAGKMRIDEYRNVILPALRKEASASSDIFKTQELNDLEAQVIRFEKRIYDLELTRQIALQTGPQIRMIQNNDLMLLEKIRSSIANTIPLWKNQMVLALSIEHSSQAMQAQNAVSNLTNELLARNASMLHQSSVEIAKESERGIVDIETLKKTNKELLDTLSEVIEIQSNGRKARQAAEVELANIENELKSKLISMSDEPQLTLKHDKTNK